MDAGGHAPPEFRVVLGKVDNHGHRWMGVLISVEQEVAVRGIEVPVLLSVDPQDSIIGASLACRTDGELHLDCYLHGCPCGYFGDPRRACTCAPGAIGRYQKQ
jgi:hypothetical protein